MGHARRTVVLLSAVAFLLVLLVKAIYEGSDAINRAGVTVLVVEQNAHLALKHSRRAYVLETGRVVMEAQSAQLADDPRVKEAYLGEG